MAGANTAAGGGDTEIKPVDAFVGTVAWILVLFMTVKLAAFTLPNITAEAPVKFIPVITTFVVGPPLGGLKLVIFGATKKLVAG